MTRQRKELRAWQRRVRERQEHLLFLQAEGQDITQAWTDHLTDLRACEQAVDEYNTVALKLRQQARKQRETAAAVRANTAANAQARARMCPVCFTVRSASNVCLCD